MDQLEDEEVGLHRDTEGGHSVLLDSTLTDQGISSQRSVCVCSYAAAGGDGDLDGVPARLADVLQVQRLVGSFVVTSLDGEGRGIHAHLGKCRKRRRGKRVNKSTPPIRNSKQAPVTRLKSRPGRRPASWCSSVDPRGGNT